jgi:hypothetical protein
VFPGRNGFQPQLALAYSTGQGNGPFGLGWNLSIPALTRRTEKGVPRYADRDVFVLSGAEDLVPVEETAAFVRGEQIIRHDVLLAGAGAVYRWRREWCSGLDAGSVTVELLDTHLQSAFTGICATRFPSGESLWKESWLLAESWWAQTFKTPTFLDVARRTVFIMPLAIRMHLGPRLRNAMCLIQRAANPGRGPQTVGDTTQGFAEIARCMLLATGLVIGPGGSTLST